MQRLRLRITGPTVQLRAPSTACVNLSLGRIHVLSELFSFGLALMSDDYKIYVDGGAPATLNDGAGISTDCATLQEAVLAWQRLTPEQKIRATVKLIGGPVYTAHQIARFHYGTKQA